MGVYDGLIHSHVVRKGGTVSAVLSFPPDQFWAACCLGICSIDISSGVDDAYQAVKVMLHLTSTEQSTISSWVSDTVEDPVCSSMQCQEANLLGQ